MGSYYMNTSYSRMPLHGRTTVIIGLQRKMPYIDGYQVIPLTLPVTGTYWDYGLVHDFDDTPASRAIAEYFGLPKMDDVVDLVYRQTIHGNYADDLRRVARGLDPLDPGDFKVYSRVLSRLRESSGIVLRTAGEIDRDDPLYPSRFKNKHEEELTKLLDSYGLVLFYEAESVWKALCSPSGVHPDGTPVQGYTLPGDLLCWGEYVDDRNNLFIITGTPPCDEVTDLLRLWENFRREGKIFRFTEATISGQEECPYLWYSYGKAIHEYWRNRINMYQPVGKKLE